MPRSNETMRRRNTIALVVCLTVLGIALVRHTLYTPNLDRYDIVWGVASGRPGSIEYENGFEYTGNARKAEADLLFIFGRFKKEMMKEFPDLKEQQIQREGWSFRAVLDAHNPFENVGCNMHSADKYGVESIGPSLTLRNRDLKCDFRFFWQPKDMAKRAKLESLVKRVFGL